MGRAWRERGRQATGRDELICLFRSVEWSAREWKPATRTGTMGFSGPASFCRPNPSTVVRALIGELSMTKGLHPMGGSLGSV